MEDLPAESLPTPPNYGKRRSPDSGSVEVIFGLIRLARNEIYRSHPRDKRVSSFLHCLMGGSYKRNFNEN